MGKRIFTLALVVVLGVLLGVGIVVKKERQPLLRELLNQQNELLLSQKNIEKKLVMDEGPSSPVAGLLQKQQDLERRLSVLESQWKGLQEALKNVGGAGGAAARPEPPKEDFTTVHEIPIDHSPVRGNKKAPVTIVEFVDFQCPYCARFHPPVVEALKAYPNDVNYILKNFPLSFHPQAKPASKAAFAAGEQGKYWEMVDLLLENGRSLSEDKFKELAGTLGLDVNKFMEDYKNKDAQWEGYIQKDIGLAQKVGVRGTPTFYINGRKTNARNFDMFKKEIDAILKENK